MRILLLRLLLGWWMIPLSWIVLYPLFWLLSPKEAKPAVIELNKVCWRGFDD